MSMRWRVGVALACAGVLAALPAGASTHRHHPARPVLSRSAHVAFGSCPAADVVMQVTLSRLTFTAAQPVNVRVTISDVGPAGCSFSGSGPVTAAGAPALQYIGPCGVTGLEFDNARGADVWPGSVAYGCPMLMGRQLLSGTHMVANGSWNQQENPSGHGRAPRGNYRLKVGGHLFFTIVLR
jgi:hypothetical protein